MSEIIPLFGAQTTMNGQKLSSGLARQAKRQSEEVALRTEQAAVAEQARTFLVSQAMNNVSTLILQARAHVQVDPGGADLYEGLIRAHAAGSVSRISRF